MPDPTVTFTDEDRYTLREVARGSIAHGLANRTPLPVNPGEHSANLQRKMAVFVTLHLHHDLRGCIGNTAPVATLIEDTARNAYGAAFNDPRFPPVNAREAPQLDIKLSILTPPAPLHVDSEAHLIEQLRPGVDGLVLTAGRRRSTFLPSVWETLGDPRRFLAHLKLKAGLDPDAWPDDIHFDRYEAIEI